WWSTASRSPTVACQPRRVRIPSPCWVWPQGGHEEEAPWTAIATFGNTPLLRAMAPVAPLVRADRPQQIALAEGRPIDIDDAELGVCQLPQEKVGHPLRPRGTDHEVRVGHAAGIQVLGHALFTDVLQAELAVRMSDEDALDRVPQLLLGAVAQADREHQPLIRLRGLRRDRNGLHHPGWQQVELAHGLAAHLVLMHLPVCRQLEKARFVEVEQGRQFLW